MPKVPHNEHMLELAIVRRAGNDNERALADRMTMANAIVGQLLGPGAGVKGGSSLRFRYGSADSRYTMDFDMTRKIGLEEFLSCFKRRLATGWSGFTGECDILPQANPRGVPFDYIMQPVRVRLKYRNQPWCSVSLEITKASCGCADQFDEIMPNEETIALFRDLGFPDPEPVYAMKLDHQVAQKLRGVCCVGSERAHDLIDLQLIMQREQVFLPRVKTICRSIFRGKDCPGWPTKVVKGANWDAIYERQKLSLPVLASVDEAVAWANRLIQMIDET